MALGALFASLTIMYTAVSARPARGNAMCDRLRPFRAVRCHRNRISGGRRGVPLGVSADRARHGDGRVAETEQLATGAVARGLKARVAAAAAAGASEHGPARLEATLSISRDNVIFADRFVDAARHRSAARTPPSQRIKLIAVCSMPTTFCHCFITIPYRLTIILDSTTPRVQLYPGGNHRDTGGLLGLLNCRGPEGKGCQPGAACERKA
jgi:hypothetical protein